MFTRVYLYLHFTYVYPLYSCSPMFTRVFLCLVVFTLFTYVYQCLRVYVYQIFSHVYSFFSSSSSKLFVSF